MTPDPENRRTCRAACSEQARAAPRQRIARLEAHSPPRTRTRSDGPVGSSRASLLRSAARRLGRRGEALVFDSRSWQPPRVDLEQWWPNLSPPEQQWLIDHNGESLSSELQIAVIRAGGSFSPDTWWSDSGNESPGFTLTDEAVDWIEAAANGETPAPRHERCAPR